MVRMRYLSTNSCLGELGHGHTRRCAFHVVTSHMTSGICCVIDCMVVGSLQSYCTI